MAERLLALDVGEARIGVAAGEVGSSFVFGRGVLERRPGAGEPDAVAAVVDLAAREGAALVVVGLPRRTDGRDSAQTQRVRTFARALEAAGLRVAFEDERFTTTLAAQQIRASGLPRGKRRQKGRLDEAAARLILESYLARRAREATSDGSADGSADGSTDGSTDGSADGAAQGAPPEADG